MAHNHQQVIRTWLHRIVWIELWQVTSHITLNWAGHSAFLTNVVHLYPPAHYLISIANKKDPERHLVFCPSSLKLPCYSFSGLPKGKCSISLTLIPYVSLCCFVTIITCGPAFTSLVKFYFWLNTDLSKIFGIVCRFEEQLNRKLLSGGVSYQSAPNKS